MGFLKFFKKKKLKDSMLVIETTTDFNYDNKTKKSAEYKRYEELQTVAIFLNWAKKGYPILPTNNYPAYMTYKLNINNPIKFHNEMIVKGYLEKPNIYSLFFYFKVSELKKILTDNNLPKTGNKDILIERILNNVPNEYILKIHSNYKGYVLSSKGDKFIKDNINFVEMHKNSNWMISLDEYINKKNQLKFDASFYDIAWGIFNDRNIQYYCEKNWGLVRNNILNMSEILNNENKPKQSLSFLLSVLYYDLSGLGNNNILYEFKYIDCPPGIVERILKLKKFYSDDLINNCHFISQLPFSYFTLDTFKSIINDLLNTNEINLDDYKNYIQKPDKNIIETI